MKRKIVAILLLSIMICTNLIFNVGAEKVELLPAAVVDSAGEKWGYINEAGAYIIKPQYSSVSDFNDNGIAIVSNANYENKPDVYFINKQGKIVSGPFLSYNPKFENGMAILNTDETGSVMVDETGKVILKSKFSLYEYSEGLASFSDLSNKLYGFMDLKGKIVISAKYLSVRPFSDGKSIVEVSAGKYSVIDKAGKVLEVLKYFNGYSTEGITVYYDISSSKYGYKNKDGTIAIKPKFREAEQFTDGYAAVGIDAEGDGAYGVYYGLLNEKGEYAIKPEYSGIHYLGHGLYSVSKNFYSTNYDMFAPKAIFNYKGEQLTDYKYYSVAEFDGDYAAASDNTTTFFIDLKGNIVDKLPRLKGIGKMELTGDIIKAELDGGLAYLKTDGNIIWQKDETISFDNNIKVKKIKYRRDYLTYIEYPEVAGIEDKAVQESVNKELKKYFIEGYENAKNQTDDNFYEDNNISFSASKNKNLLTIEKSGYEYPIGAAHGMPSKDYLYIDTKTGASYQLKDLFKANSKYTEELTAIVNSQIKQNARIGAISGAFAYNENSITISENQYFILGSDSIKIYYYPYEIAAYAAGFPEFEIPYGQIASIIDTKGDFWNSFDKKIVNHKIDVISDITDDKIKSIESVMSSYEKNIIEAVNSNNFSKVEACLQKGSNLYNSQKKLVQSLYQKNTKEKLTKYEIYAIDYDYDKAEFRVYVQEEVAIKYTGKDYVNKSFGWCYTIKADKTGNYFLSDIVKW